MQCKAIAKQRAVDTCKMYSETESKIQSTSMAHVKEAPTVVREEEQAWDLRWNSIKYTCICLDGYWHTSQEAQKLPDRKLHSHKSR